MLEIPAESEMLVNGALLGAKALDAVLGSGLLWLPPVMQEVSDRVG